MTTNVVQVRMPSVLLKNMEELVKKGFYKNKSEAIIDAVRHFVGFREAESDVATFLREELRGMHLKRGYSDKELEAIWEKIRKGREWKERFGEDVESVMAELRRRK